VQMARENCGWGYDRIAGALANLGHEVSDQTVGNVLRRHGIAPAPKRSQTMAWKDFIASHMAVLAGMDFFTAEVLTWRGPATYYVLFVIQLETRHVTVAGMTRHPTQEWMQQIARNLTDADAGALRGQRYLLHDRETKFCDGFRSVLRIGGVEPMRLPARSPESLESRRSRDPPEYDKDRLEQRIARACSPPECRSSSLRTCCWTPGR
jgi:hypothetical protein